MGLLYRLMRIRSYNALTKFNRFHVAMHLFSNTSRSQMTSRCGKNKQVAHEPLHNIYLLYFNKETKKMWTSSTCTCLLSNRPQEPIKNAGIILECSFTKIVLKKLLSTPRTTYSKINWLVGKFTITLITQAVIILQSVTNDTNNNNILLS